MEELSKTLAQFAQELKEPATEAVLEAARMEAFSSLSGNVLMMIFGTVSALLARKLWKAMNAKDNDWDEPQFIGAIIGLCVLAIVISVGIIGFCQMFDPWLYATMTNPELWVAKKILGL